MENNTIINKKEVLKLSAAATKQNHPDKLFLVDTLSKYMSMYDAPEIKFTSEEYKRIQEIKQSLK
jgi:hypothetical protein